MALNVCLAGAKTEALLPTSSLLTATAAAPVPPSIKATIDLTVKHTSGYMTHPAVMDAALHLAAGISDPKQTLVLRVPSSVASVSAQGLHPGRVYPTASQTSSSGETVTCGIKLCTAVNSRGAQVSGLVAKEIQKMETKQTEEAVADFLYETEMQACQIIPGNASSDRSLVASLGGRQNKKASLVYGQLRNQEARLPMPSSTRMIVDAADLKDSRKAAIRYSGILNKPFKLSDKACNHFICGIRSPTMLPDTNKDCKVSGT